MTRVALLKCRAYNLKIIRETLKEGLMLAGIDPGVFKNRKVGLKPNLLAPSHPDKCIITHPEVFRAVVQIVKEWGGNPLLIENSPFISLEKVIAKTGYREIIETEGVPVADVRETIKVTNGPGSEYREFHVSRAFTEIDLLVNIPKLKTHSLTSYTGAVKNLFGAIPGLKKAEWHIRASNRETFSGMLIDLYTAMRNSLRGLERVIHIMDAIEGMEGEGPGSGGDPKHAGALIISEDPIALDFVAADIVKLDQEEIYTTKIGKERGIGTSGYKNIDLRGESIESFSEVTFRPSSAGSQSNMLALSFSPSFIRRLTTNKPVPREKRCTLCYQCKKICPANAISPSGNKGKKVPLFDYDKCIRCYCCMEVCPEAAIDLRKGILNWLVRIR
jgi:uncharacterized protein (DUF362 family)/Pyruvate/2-oxoacid:ferredoxin oxidoreductase delta subunit